LAPCCSFKAPHENTVSALDLVDTFGGAGRLFQSWPSGYILYAEIRWHSSENGVYLSGRSTAGLWPHIVVAASPETYRLSEGHRWAERLDDNIARVSMENLGALLPASRIILYPWPREPKPDGQITLDIQEMHLTQEGRVLMQALWSFRGRQSPQQSFRFSCNEPASTTDFAKMVEVESHCLERLNRDMAKSVQGFR
jgi:uncharacterized lipoprotein YmbA